MRLPTRTALFIVCAALLGAGCFSHDVTMRDGGAGRITLALPGALVGYRAGLAAQTSNGGDTDSSFVQGIRVRISLAGEVRTLLDKTFNSETDCGNPVIGNVDVVVDTTVVCTLNVSFNYPPGSDASTFQFVADAQNPLGATLYKIGPSTFTLNGGIGGVTAPAVYVGPGSDATGVVLNPRSVSVGVGGISTASCSPTRAQVPTGAYAPMVVTVADPTIGYVFFTGPNTVQVVGGTVGTTQITCSLDFGTHAQDVIDLNVSSDSTNTIRLVLVSGDKQAGSAGKALGSPLVLRAVDVQGAPVKGVEVIGGVVDGTLTPSVGTTDANGLFTTTWTLGSAVGSQSALFGLSGGQFTLTVTATAR